jgi:hypothetical protein
MNFDRNYPLRQILTSSLNSINVPSSTPSNSVRKILYILGPFGIDLNDSHSTYPRIPDETSGFVSKLAAIAGAAHGLRSAVVVVTIQMCRS